MTHFSPDYTIQWYYNERHHGKGPMDGVGGTVKNMISQQKKKKKYAINGVKDLAVYANKIMVFLAFTWLKTKSWQNLKISKRHEIF